MLLGYIEASNYIKICLASTTEIMILMTNQGWSSRISTNLNLIKRFGSRKPISYPKSFQSSQENDIFRYQLISMYHFRITTIYIYIYILFSHSILNPMSLSILNPIHHQFYPTIIAQSITYKSKLSNHIFKNNNNNKTFSFFL